jgi:hypothetical protein
VDHVSGPNQGLYSTREPASRLEIEYRQKRYAKVGKYWGMGLLSPSGKWLAVFSYNGEQPPPDLFFLGGIPREGDVFWQI